MFLLFKSFGRVSVYDTIALLKVHMDCQKCDLCHRSKVPSSDAFFKRQIVKKVLQTNLQKLVLSILPF